MDQSRSRLIDVAKLAGVSLGSASRALTTPDSVKAKTLKAVLAAAEQLAYVPDGRARSLAMRRSFTIGVILPTVNNPVYADFGHALQQRLGESNYSLLVSAHEYDRQTEVETAKRLLQRGVDGLVLVGTDHDAQVITQIQRAKIPYIFTWSADSTGAVNFVGFHNRRAMHQIAQHLINLGHQRMAVLSGPTQHNERARARLDGVIDAVALAGGLLPDECVIYGEFSVQAGREGLRRALQLKPRPTALICSTDLVAAGALSEAANAGIKVPEDLSITGFDDIVYASLLTPQLTTVHVPTAELGQKTGEAILRLVAGLPNESSVLDTRLIIRGSTGPAPRPSRK